VVESPWNASQGPYARSVDRGAARPPTASPLDRSSPAPIGRGPPRSSGPGPAPAPSVGRFVGRSPRRRASRTARPPRRRGRPPRLARPPLRRGPPRLGDVDRRHRRHDGPELRSAVEKEQRNDKQ